MTDADKHVQFVHSDDWVVLYLNGKKADEGHSLDPYRVLAAVGITVDESISYSEREVEAMGWWFPESAAELPPAIDYAPKKGR